MTKFRVYITIDGTRKFLHWNAATASDVRRDLTTLCTMEGRNPESLNIRVSPEVFACRPTIGAIS